MKLFKNLMSGAAIVLLLTVFTHAGVNAGSHDTPDGRYVCEGFYIVNDSYLPKTIEITIGDQFPRGADAHPDAPAQVYGLNEKNASYMFSDEQLVVYAPPSCLVGDNAQRFIDCAYLGIIELNNGSFAFFRGDYPGGDMIFASRMRDGKICVKTE